MVAAGESCSAGQHGVTEEERWARRKGLEKLWERGGGRSGFAPRGQGPISLVMENRKEEDTPYLSPSLVSSLGSLVERGSVNRQSQWTGDGRMKG